MESPRSLRLLVHLSVSLVKLLNEDPFSRNAVSVFHDSKLPHHNLISCNQQ